MTPTGTPMEGVIDRRRRAADHDHDPCIRARRSARPPSPSGGRRIEALPSGDGRILAGDFNATFDHPEFRALLDRGYVDAADAAGAGPEADVARAAATATRAAADDRPHPRRPPRARGARHRRADPAQRPPRRDRRAAPTLRRVTRSLAAALVVALLSVPLAVMVLGALHAPGQPPPVGLGDRPRRAHARRVRARVRARPARPPAAELADDRGHRGAADGRLRVAHRASR